MQRSLVTLLIVLATQPLAAQRAVRIAVGATRSSDLAHDAVLDNTILKLAIAPTITAGVALPINQSGSYRIVVEGAFGTSNRSATDDSHTTSSLGKVGTLSATAMLDGQIHGPLRWQAGGGILFYLPSEHSGVFLDGGTHRYQVAGGLSWSHPLNKATDLLMLGRYAFHEFSTPTLVNRGYASYQSVHRVGLQFGVERRF